MPTDSSHSQPDHTSESQAPSESAPQSNSASREQQDKWFWEHTLYDELRRLAAARMSAERNDHTLQATALVHEAYMRLVDTERPQQWDSRGHFFAAAAEAMRRILVESARKRQRREAIRGPRVPLSELDSVTAFDDDQILQLDEALQRLESGNAVAAQLVKLRFFAGLTMAQIAESLGIPLRTAERQWTFARTWLHRELDDER